MTSGPGASSMRGLFTEIGPCMIEVGQNETTPNPHSWNNNASLLVIDQPAGVGFSDVKPGGTYAAGDLEAARDLQEFLRLFFANVFPERAHLPIHFAGESYGGHYVPVTVKHILDSREWKSADAFWGNITSMILVNSIVHRLQSSIGHYELMCTDYRGKLWNDTVCERLASGLPTVEEMNSACEVSADGRTCGAMEDLCMKLSLGILFEESQAGKRNRYNEAIGFPQDYRYDNSDDGAGSAIADSFDPYAPTVRQVAAILDASAKYSHRRGMADIRLLVLNGNEDGLVNTPGVKWLYERLPWSGAYGYRAQKWKQLVELGLSSEIATGEWKGTEDGRLLVFTVDEAGHMVPQDQPEAASWALRKWIGNEI
ncbi:hypothetical protein K4F52_000891 [Lecanicillium sp. MT-2017a]|nr:hypothetical protein K4F52_000891 [Lecanicillium sp. MT-2017a]